MAGLVMFTGVTILPYDEASASRVTSFRVEYSKKGLKWISAYSDTVQKQKVSTQSIIYKPMYPCILPRYESYVPL